MRRPAPVRAIFLLGMPEQVHRAVVTACLTPQDCQSFRWRPRLTTQVPLVLPPGAWWSELDDTRMRITIQDHHARWSGTATIHYRPSGGSPCDCGDLHANLSVAPVSSRPG